MPSQGVLPYLNLAGGAASGFSTCCANNINHASFLVVFWNQAKRQLGKFNGIPRAIWHLFERMRAVPQDPGPESAISHLGKVR
jgi:hypothetical protein